MCVRPREQCTVVESKEGPLSPLRTVWQRPCAWAGGRNLVPVWAAASRGQERLLSRLGTNKSKRSPHTSQVTRSRLITLHASSKRSMVLGYSVKITCECEQGSYRRVRRQSCNQNVTNAIVKGLRSRQQSAVQWTVSPHWDFSGTDPEIGRRRTTGRTPPVKWME